MNEINELKAKIEAFLTENGVGAVGFCSLKPDSNPFEMTAAVSFLIPLSNAVVDSIEDAPTHTYFHHYRTVNTHIDSLSLKTGFILDRAGFSYAPVPASQSVGGTFGMFSHKYAASLAGLGAVGKSGLFVSKKYGPRVRLGTILTDCDFEVENAEPICPCGECRLCVSACPAQAISGEKWVAGEDRGKIIDAKACSDYMKKAF